MIMIMKMATLPILTSEVNFLTGHALFSISKDNIKLKILWAVRVLTTVAALMLVSPCTFNSIGAIVTGSISGALYFVSDSIFKQRANPEQVAQQFDIAQISIVNFVFDFPGIVVSSYDRFIVPLLNIFWIIVLVVMFTVLKPLEEAWGCYKSSDIGGLEYGTCPEFDETGVTNALDISNICSRPEATINCVTRPSAFASERTARTVALIAFVSSTVLYASTLTERKLRARAILLEKS